MFNLVSGKLAPHLKPALVAGFGMVLLLASGYAAQQELSLFLSPAGSERAKVVAHAAGEVLPGLSIQSQTSYLLDCNLVMNSVAGRAQTSSVRTPMIETCLSGSTRIAGVSPTFSLAWLVAATALSFQREWGQFRDAFRNSYRTAPTEQWIAEIRIDVAERNYSNLDTTLRQLHEDDLKLLLATNSGREFLAPRYIAWNEMRDRVDEVLKSVPGTWVNRFRRIVKRL